ncbi:MAG: hypothetical protein HC804_06545, partial [Anaerolineae bacterium]|nr:hypothetical protein [Anaerolineae bacterium]
VIGENGAAADARERDGRTLRRDAVGKRGAENERLRGAEIRGAGGLGGGASREGADAPAVVTAEGVAWDERPVGADLLDVRQIAVVVLAARPGADSQPGSWRRRYKNLHHRNGME